MCVEIFTNTQTWDLVVQHLVVNRKGTPTSNHESWPTVGQFFSALQSFTLTHYPNTLQIQTHCTITNIIFFYCFLVAQRKKKGQPTFPFRYITKLNPIMFSLFLFLLHLFFFLLINELIFVMLLLKENIRKIHSRKPNFQFIQIIR